MKVRLANLPGRVRVSLGAPFIRSYAISKQKVNKLLIKVCEQLILFSKELAPLCAACIYTLIILSVTPKGIFLTLLKFNFHLNIYILILTR